MYILPYQRWGGVAPHRHVPNSCRFRSCTHTDQITSYAPVPSVLITMSCWCVVACRTESLDMTEDGGSLDNLTVDSDDQLGSSVSSTSGRGSLDVSYEATKQDGTTEPGLEGKASGDINSCNGHLETCNSPLSVCYVQTDVQTSSDYKYLILKSNFYV